MKKKLSSKFIKMSELYKLFASEWDCLLFNEDMLYEMYQSETYGKPHSNNNGYYHGKKWLNVQVTSWKEDIKKGLLNVNELYDDPKFPHWFLDSIFKK